jgi:hypothetical protein
MVAVDGLFATLLRFRLDLAGRFHSASNDSRAAMRRGTNPQPNSKDHPGTELSPQSLALFVSQLKIDLSVSSKPSSTSFGARYHVDDRRFQNNISLLKTPSTR